MKTFKNCQSCGMPLRKDPKKGGSNADGSRSIMYCSYCYQDGAFTQPDYSVDDMKKFCVGKMKEMGFPGMVARLFAAGLPRLERWKNTK
ncbi:MAG: zinc ribbon domain-containing protein [Flavobacteriales bacterium]